jgi:hypothetical protein
MAQEWYYTRDGKQGGPVSSSQLRELAASGQLMPTDTVWMHGMATWKEAQAVKGLFPPLQPTARGQGDVIRVQASNSVPAGRTRNAASKEDEPCPAPRFAAGNAGRQRRRAQIIIGVALVGSLVLVGVIVAIVLWAGGFATKPKTSVPTESATASQSKLTKDNILKITDGMTIDDVELILGKPTERRVFDTVHLKWVEGGKDVFIVFAWKDSAFRVRSKAHKGFD